MLIVVKTATAAMAEACGGACEPVVLWLIVLSEEVALLAVGVVVPTVVPVGAGVVITMLMGPELIV